MRIETLVVEDEPMVREIICEYLAKSGGFAVVAQAGSGHEALEICRNREVELIILDIHMPVMNGVEFLTQLRGDGNAADVIFLTASNDTQMIARALNLGAVDYLIKPFTYERFLGALQSYTRRYQLLRQTGETTQEELDSMLAQSGRNPTSVVLKGLHPKTLEHVRNYIGQRGGEAVTQQDIAQHIGLSKVTARKYLEYLVSIGEMAMAMEYGAIGRPTHIYHRRQPD